MIGKHRPYASGRLRLGHAGNLLCRSVNISAVVRQPVNAGLLIRERRKLFTNVAAREWFAARPERRELAIECYRRLRF
jgi:hypothetical protein